jgi:diguanylate cyclase (GGDEF)-like protein
VKKVAGPVRRLGRLFSTILLLSLIAIWLLFVGIVYESYVTEVKTAHTFVENVDSLVEMTIARNIEFYDLSLKAAASGYLDPDIRNLPPKRRQQVLFDQSANASGLGAMVILDANGKAVADSQSEIARDLDVSDRDYFKVHAFGPKIQDLFVSHPFQSRLQKDVQAIAISRRIDDAQGRFVGVVFGAIKLSYFASVFNSVKLPPGSTITILHDDGTILMRSPFIDIGRNMAASELFKRELAMRSGLLTQVSSIDGIERVFAFRRVDQLPIMLAVGVPTRYYLTDWRWRAAFVGLGFFMLSGFILVLAVTLGTELDRRTLAERALLELATTDSLTALANRRRFDDVLENEWVRAIREGTSAALLMVDCDFFKSYNDTYGHLQGDEALRAVAGALRDSVQRPADLVARFGGEEFAILLPGTDLDGALLLGEIIRDAVARLACKHVRSPFGNLTVSIGAAACLPSPDRDALSLVQAADFALYEAKEKGRNRTETGESLDLTGFGWRAAS